AAHEQVHSRCQLHLVLVPSGKTGYAAHIVIAGPIWARFWVGFGGPFGTFHKEMRKRPPVRWAWT
ncbi:MAG: hypothetical protein II290_04020, partial [Oscillospiraceae bacterium]|nr:hypothetical protein [Oscillospiraceae bacterium]